MLELKGIHKSYRGKRFEQKALTGIEIAFRDTESVILLGPDGSGKTSFLKVISGLSSYDEGDLLFNGASTKNFRQKDWDKFRNHKIGFISKNHNLISYQTVLANVKTSLALAGKNSIKRI